MSAFGHDLLTKMFSWSIEDINNKDLYRDQVELIPDSFESVEQYLSSYVLPLLEETRAELCSSMENISDAPYAEVLSVIERSRGAGGLMFKIEVGSWKNMSGEGSKMPYKTLPGDFFFILNTNPCTLSDLRMCMYDTCAFASVTKVGYDMEDDSKHEFITTCTNFTVEASKPIRFKNMTGMPVSKGAKVEYEADTSLFVVFLTNITTTKRIWYSLHNTQNTSFIQRMLSYDSLVGDAECTICLPHNCDFSDEMYGSQLFSTLNKSQFQAVVDSISKSKCTHRSSVDLIWGPPGTGKTKTVSTLLFALQQLKCRTLLCAPTNVAVKEVASRVLKLVKDGFKTENRNNDLFCSVGDILLFGNKDRLNIDSDFEIHEIYLNYRIDKLAECFGPVKGWIQCFAAMKAYFDDCVSEYNIFIQISEKVDKSFLTFARERFKSHSSALRDCVWTFCTLISKCYLGRCNYQKMEKLIRLLDKFEHFLFQKDVESGELQELFSFEGVVEDGPPLHYLRIECISILDTLRRSFHDIQFPDFRDSHAIEVFCFQTASLFFCTSSSSYRLHSVHMAPLNFLVIDEAAQLKECESTIPLQLPGLSHVLLVGDEYQLPAMVKSNVCSEAGFGRSLFERLSMLGKFKHLLNIQYRMHPEISCFPNSKFYANQIQDAANVKCKSYEKCILQGPIFGPYSFINIFDGKEEKADVGYSKRNMVEVAVVSKIVHNLHKACIGSKMQLSIGIVSPYTAQVIAFQEKLGKKYEKLENFGVKVKSIDGFQGGEEDIIIISTVRANKCHELGFITDPKRTNVGLTRARHCLWILGNERTLASSQSIWRDIVLDAKSRQCFFNADEDREMSKAIIEVKKEFDQLEDLLNGESLFFNKARWKVLFSDDFKKSFRKLKPVGKKALVLNLLLKLASGWRPKTKNINIDCSSELLKQFKVECHLYVVSSIDIKKDSNCYMQVLKVWDILPLEEVSKLAKRLDNIFSNYTNDFISRCKGKCVEGDLEVPKTWVSFDVARLKDSRNTESDASVIDGDSFDGRSYVENLKVNESLLLMKFYSLSPFLVSHLLTDNSARDLDLPFEVTDQELEIINFRASTFVLGRSGTGKTTVLTMKLYRNEQQCKIVMNGVSQDRSDQYQDVKTDKFEDVQNNKGADLHQLFVTVSPKLSYAIKRHVSDLKRIVHGTKLSIESSSTNVDYMDDTNQHDDIPDSFIDVPLKFYPLVITFHKFLMMLDGTLGKSYFERFPDVRDIFYGKTISKSIALQNFIRTREVNYERFSFSYWPHFNTQLTKQLDPSTAFTEIISHIKGGMNALDGKLSREDYVLLSKGRNSFLTKRKRETVYDIFQQYETLKVENGDYDVSDLVIDLHRRFKLEKYRGDEIHFVYIDEVQDLTMRQISLFKYICRNVDEGFVFSGDTAQTIMKGVEFRFEDIRSLFYKEFMVGSKNKINNGKEDKGIISPILHLNQNFRTHDGILKLAQSIISLLYRFFPSSIDILDPETSLIYGEAPVLLESGNDENAIITIFGNSGSTEESENISGNSRSSGFGAEQVILVRDDESKKQIANYVGKQALILTIVECKGLEFQDVLLYNFFGSSPLKNHWRVIYNYMMEQNLLDSPEPFPTFNETKHNVLCSDLKHLYVAITRTRQRLWICENLGLSKPIFDYWKKLSLVQIRKLDDSLAQAMQVSSTPEQWKSRGIKLLEECNYEMATMCFERAGDSYRERLSKARGLRASADRIHGVNPEMSRVICREAAEIFEAISDSKSAAECYFQLDEFEKAGTLYLENCGESELEVAGQCFFRAGCYERAAEVYARGNFFSNCLSVCTTGKYFDMGLRYIQYWKKHAPPNSGIDKRSDNIEQIEQTFLETCALHYHRLNDKPGMMKFVKAFNSVDNMRTLLRNLSCLEELMLLEVEAGNFLDAAEIARLRLDLVLEADLLGKAYHFKEASKLILWYVFARSLWTSGSFGWPLKKFPEKQELLSKAVLFSKNESDIFHESVLKDAKILSDEPSSLFELIGCMSPHQNTRLRNSILSARKILDIHLISNSLKFEFDDELVTDLRKFSEDKFSFNKISVDTLFFCWRYWQEEIENILKYLGCVETEEVTKYVEYEDFCLNYLGLKEYHNNVNTNYVLLYPEANWVKEIDGRFLRRIENLVIVNARHFVFVAESYWLCEIFSVGLKVLSHFESLYKLSVKNSLSCFAQSKVLIHMFSAAKVLTGFKFKNQETKRVQYFIEFSANNFFHTAFSQYLTKPLTTKMFHLRKAERSRSLLREAIRLKLNHKGKVSYGPIGTVIMIIFGSGNLLTDEIQELIEKRILWNAPWTNFITNIGKGSFSNESSRSVSVIFRWHEAIQDTYNANWLNDSDYISPTCFLYIFERLLLLASSHSQGRYMFTTRSSFVEWFISLEQHAVTSSTQSAVLPSTLDPIFDFMANAAVQLLYDKRIMSQWCRMCNLNFNVHYPTLVLRLVVIVCLICLRSEKYKQILFAVLGRSEVHSQLPREFYGVLRSRSRRALDIDLLAVALKKVGNPLVVVSFGSKCLEFPCSDLVLLDMNASQSQEQVFQILFPEETKVSSRDHKLQIKDSISMGDQYSKAENDTENSDLLRVYSQLCQFLGDLSLAKNDNIRIVEFLKAQAPKIKAASEESICILTGLLTVETVAENFCLEANEILVELKELVSALNVSDLELESTIPIIQQLLAKLALKKPVLDRLISESSDKAYVTKPVSEQDDEPNGATTVGESSKKNDGNDNSNAASLCGSQNKSNNKGKSNNSKKGKNRKREKNK